MPPLSDGALHLSFSLAKQYFGLLALSTIFVVQQEFVLEIQIPPKPSGADFSHCVFGSFQHLPFAQNPASWPSSVLLQQAAVVLLVQQADVPSHQE